MTSWRELTAELDLWAESGTVASFWWRDDDAIEPTSALDRLLSLSNEKGVPVAVAVIPAAARRELRIKLSSDGVDVLQHGYAHQSHSKNSEKKAELGNDRPMWDVASELAEGRSRMFDIFGDEGWVNVMVPPWNRIDPSIMNLLPGLGYSGLSTFAPRRAAHAPPGLTLVNTHIDLIDWRKTRRYAGDDAILSATISHLAAKRQGRADPEEATGLLTHHLSHDEECWACIQKLINTISDHVSARWQSAKALFPIHPQ